MPPETITGCVLGLTPEILSGWRDGTLHDAEMVRIGQHIETCQACQARLQQYELVAQALRSIERLSGEQRTPINPRLHPRKNRRTRLRIVYPGNLSALIAALILVGLAGLIPVLAPHHQNVAIPTVTPTPIARVSATIDLTAPPTGKGSGPWFLDSTDHRVIEVDQATNTVARALTVPDDTTNIASAVGSLWIARSTAESVERLDPLTGRIQANIPLHEPLRAGFAVSPGAIWVGSGAANTIWRIDTGSNRVVATISVGEFPRMLDVGDGSVWVCEGHDKLGLWRIDIGANRVVAKLDISEGEMAQCAGVWVTSDGAVWALNRLNDPSTPSDHSDLLRIDPATDRVVKIVPVGDGVNNAFVATASAIWVVSYQNQALLRVDPQGKRPVTAMTLGGTPNSVSLLDGILWVQSGIGQADGSIAPTTTVWRMQPNA